MLSPASLGQQWQVTQSVTMQPLSSTADTSHQPQTLLAAWSVNAERLDLAGLTPTGQTLLTLSYNGTKLSENTSSLLPKEVSGRDILTQLQLAYWPPRVIHQALADSGWGLKVTELKVTGNRQLYWGQQLALTITVSRGNATNRSLESITIVNHLRGYQLQIQTLSREYLETTHSKSKINNTKINNTKSKTENTESP